MKPMELVDMSEQDLAGVLFTEFPESLSMAESRRMLERMIRRNGDFHISPGTIYCAFFAMRWRLGDGESGPAVELRRERLHPGRFPIRYVENGADPNDPDSLKWNAKARKPEYAIPRTADWSFDA